MTDIPAREIIERLVRIETEAKGAHEQGKKTNGRISKLEKNQLKIIVALVFAFGLIMGIGFTDFAPVLSILL